MAPQLMVERFPTILWDKDHMILAVPRGMAESLAVWHDKLPLGRTLSGSPEGVCRFDSWNCQTVGVPRQSRGFTLIKLVRGEEWRSRRARQTTNGRPEALAGRPLRHARRAGWSPSLTPPRLGREGAQHEPANTLPCVQEQRTGPGSYSTHGVSYASCRQPTSTSVS